MNELGYCLIVFAALSMLAGLIIGIRFPGAGRMLRACQISAALMSFSGLAVLAWLVASRDPHTAYAVQYRPPVDASAGLKIAAVWAGQAGGLLLWCVETALVALAIQPRKQPYTAAILCGIQCCLLSLVVVNNPFARSVSGTAEGLNPMLMSPMMLIHPPMLFLGYALLSVPYAITAGSLIAKNPRSWLNDVKPWILISWLALTLGNGFGASWAYKTFGWGGFWSWDPVENTSFVPWMLACAAIHGLYISTRNGKWLKITAICAMLGFITVLYGSFLARSGLLAGASVHAYLDIDRLFLWALGGLLTGAILCAGYCLNVGWKSWNPDEGEKSAVIDSTGWGTAVMLIIVLFVLIGMSLPIVGIAPMTSAYDTVLLPFAFLMVMLLVWSRLAGLRNKSLVWIRSILAVIFFLILIFSIGYARWMGGGIVYAIPALVSPAILYGSLIVIIIEIYRLLFRINCRVGGVIAHIGIAMLLIGAITSGYGTRSSKLFLHTGDDVNSYGAGISLVRIDNPREGVSRAALSVDNSTSYIEVEKNRLFSVELRKPLIKRRLLFDLYITPLAIITNTVNQDGRTITPGVMIEVSMKYGISLVWLGIIFIGLGIVFSLIRKKHHLANSCDMIETENSNSLHIP